MTTPNLLADLRHDEGLRLTAYPDPLSGGEPWTIGYGHTGPGVRPGLTISQANAEVMLEADVGIAERALDAAMPWWRNLSDERQDVIANMAFNLGVGKLEGFVHTLAFIRAGEWQAAHDGMLESAWAHQVGGRAQRLAQQMLTDVHA